MQETAKALRLRDWVRQKNFPREKYFAAIGRFETELRAFTPNPEPVPTELLVSMIAAAVDAEGALVTHVLEKSASEITQDNWLEMCQAAGWAILQLYRSEAKKIGRPVQ